MRTSFNQTACLEVNVFGIFGACYSFYQFGIFRSHCLQATLQRFQRFVVFNLVVFVQLIEISSGCDVADCCYNLQLSRAFVNIGDTGITVQTFASIVFHETGTTVNLNGIVSILIGKLGGHTFTHRCKGIGQLAVFLQFLAFFRSQFTFFGNIIESFVHIYETSCFVKHGT